MHRRAAVPLGRSSGRVSVLALATLLVACQDPAATGPPGPEELARAFDGVRPTLAWLSAFPEHAPCADTGHGACARELGLDGIAARDALRASLDSSLAAHPATPEPHHLHGLWKLAWSSSEDSAAAEAVEALEHARTLGGDEEWEILNDLAAALLLAGLDGEPHLLLRALAVADRAVATAPAALPPRFNRALVLESLGLPQASDAWRELLERGPPAGWREEAEAALARSPGEGRSRADGERSDDELKALLDALWAAERSRLAEPDALRHDRAVAAFRRGFAMYHDDRSNEAAARADLARAVRLAEGLPSVVGAWSAGYEILCRRYEPGFDPLPAITGLLAGHGGRSPALDGLLLWIDGFERVDRGELGRGVESYRRALESLAAAGLIHQELRLRGVLSDAQMRLGDLEGAWETVWQAARRTHDGVAPREAWVVWDQGAQTARALGEVEAALYFVEKGLEVTRAWKPRSEIDALLLRAELQDEIGAHAEAAEDRARARQTLDRIAGAAGEGGPAGESPEQREIRLRNRRVAEAKVLVAESRAQSLGPEAAVERLSEAIVRYRGFDLTVLLPDLHAERARHLLAVGRTDEALADLRTALADREATRRAIENAEWRSSFSTVARETIDRLLVLYRDVERRDDLVPALTDLARDADRVAPGPLPALDGRDHERLRLEPGEALLSATVLPDRVLVWTWVEGELTVAETPVGREELRRTLRELDDPDRDPEAARERLEEWIVRPVADRLAGARRLFVVLDRELRSAPVAALFGSRSDTVPITVLPAAGVLARSRPGRVATGRVALVGAGEVAAGHAPLSEVETELAALAALYPEQVRLGGGGQTVTAADLERVAAGSDVLHLAGHGASNLEVPTLSSLVLGTGTVHLPEIRALRLERARLVVLSACVGAATGHEDAAGLDSLAGAFLEAGADWVVASLWLIDDRAARRFAERFHRELLGDGRPDAALARTQEALREAGAPLKDWAGFVAIFG